MNGSFGLDTLRDLVDKHLPDRNKTLVWEEGGVVLGFKFGYEPWWLTDAGRDDPRTPEEMRQDDRINRATRDARLGAKIYQV